MQSVPLSVAIALTVAVAFYAMTIWAVWFSVVRLAPGVGGLAVVSFIATVGAAITATALAEKRRGNY